MTYRDLVIFIIKYHLEDLDLSDTLLDVEEIAKKFSVGPATVKAWISENKIKYYKIGDEYFIPDSAEPDI